jgi:hypothetical protein
MCRCRQLNAEDEEENHPTKVLQKSPPPPQEYAHRTDTLLHTRTHDLKCFGGLAAAGDNKGKKGERLHR